MAFIIDNRSFDGSILIKRFNGTFNLKRFLAQWCIIMLLSCLISYFLPLAKSEILANEI